MKSNVKKIIWIKKCPPKKQPPPNPPDNQEKEREVETTADKGFDNVNNEESENKLIFKTIIKTQDDNENTDIREANCKMTFTKQPPASTFTSKEKKQNEQSKKRKTEQEGLIAINPKVLKRQL